jgi:phosphohistidine phosphatase
MTIDLLLWRHAEAEAGSDDHSRPLTTAGHKQAERVGRWLKRHAPKTLTCYASPALRSQETLAHFSENFTIAEEIAPGSATSQVLRLLKWPDPDQSLLIVGHQPWLGETAAFLLVGSPLSWSFPRASLWWFRIRKYHPRPVQLRAVIHPDLAE